MKAIPLLFLALLISSCATRQDKSPSAAEQVKGLQKMCKDSGKDMKKRQASKSLYKRLGGKEKIQKMVTGIVEEHQNNPKIGHMFKHINKKSVIKNTTNFLVIGTGGKAECSGQDMKTTHKHMKISNDDFLSAGGDVQKVMAGLNYGKNEIQ